MIITYVFYGLIGVFIAVVFGVSISASIESTYMYVLFWMMYILSILTIINVLMTFNYYNEMRNKKGPPGRRGESGDRGDSGDAGKCDTGCRDNICYNNILEHVNKYLQGKAGNKLFKLRNMYIKQKIKQMCGSDEFKQMAPYNGPNNLIKYLCGVWEQWLDAILSSSGGTGLRYFETIGAEHDWEWVKTNPFDEIKKYDVFYWGLGPEYRPVLIDKCYVADNKGNPTDISEYDIIKVAKTNDLELITTDDNTGTKLRCSIWRPKKATYGTTTYYPVGDVVYGPTRKNELVAADKYIGQISISNSTNSDTPNIESIVVGGNVQPPIGYNKIAVIATKTNNIKQNITLWRPTPPSGYIALGDIITVNNESAGSVPPPTGEAAPIRCISEKAAIIKKAPIGSILWSTVGTNVVSTGKYYIIGYSSDKSGQKIFADDNNSYNLFRVLANPYNDIPQSDYKNGSFYMINPMYYDADDVPGANLGWPPKSKFRSMTGKGYLSSPRTNAKYSIQGYLKLRVSARVRNYTSGIELKIDSAATDNANAYNIKVLNKSTGKYDICIKALTSGKSMQITNQKCNVTDDEQYFMVEFTGDKAGECRLIHKKSGYFVAVNPTTKGIKLIKQLDENNKGTLNDTSLFMMLDENNRGGPEITNKKTS